MKIATQLLLLSGLASSLAGPAQAIIYTTLTEIIASDTNQRQQTFSNRGEPPFSSVASTAAGSFGSQASAQVAFGRIETSTLGNYDTATPPPEGLLPAGDGNAQARALGFTNDFLTIDAAAPGGFLQVALTYNNDSYFDTFFKSSEPATIVALYDIYYRFSAGPDGAEADFVDYNRRAVAISFSTGFGFTINESLDERVTGDFASGQVFMVPFTTGETLSIRMTGDCTGSVSVKDFGNAQAGCGSDQLFGWGGILGAVDGGGNPIALRSVTSLSGTDYLSNLSGLAFDPIYAVPEPAIWAQFIMGFGLAGGLVRRRRALPA